MVVLYSYESHTVRQLQTSSLANANTARVAKSIDIPDNAHYPYLSTEEIQIGTPIPW